LVLYLHEALGIKLDYLYGFDFKREYYTYQGIIKHCNVRLDKTDLSPAWDEKVFVNWIENLSKIKASEVPPAKPLSLQELKAVGQAEIEWRIRQVEAKELSQPIIDKLKQEIQNEQK
jgi:hypothetical protein